MRKLGRKPDLFRDPADEPELFGELHEAKDHIIAPIQCLGLTFPNDRDRKEYFLSVLREKLKDPEFRSIEGFPIGSDEDILALSDPPYYTACPNPFITDFMKLYGKPYDQNHPYSREPFAADVSEGKNDPIYNAHSYHTKVPHKAIMRYILHYTEPGDVIFDGFCGTGMTGVAAQMCGNISEVQSLGYKVDEDGTILQEEQSDDGTLQWKPFSKLGARLAVLNDLSPAATFIAYNYNSPINVSEFEKEATRILNEVEAECGWMYETLHTDGRTKGRINYTVWSDVFVCPECTREIVFWEAAVDKIAGSVRDEFPCPHCGAMLTKRRMERSWVSRYDGSLGQTVRQAKQVPVLINYTVNKKRAEKEPDSDDLALIDKIDSSDIPYWFPTDELPDGFNTRQPKLSHGVTHVHHFFTKRSLFVLAALYEKALESKSKLCVFFIQYAVLGFAKISRYVPNHYSQVNQYLSGTLYIGSQQVEVSPEYILLGKLYRLVKHEAPKFSKDNVAAIGCCDSSVSPVPCCTFDYMFVDPPFGANLNYSELNALWEHWFGVVTNNKTEAIQNIAQHKGLDEYRSLMTSCFKEAYRVLKPGRWMTVEFSNTKASVWNSIQTALSEAGFIVANVSALDKQQGSFKAVTTPTAVKQDLVISAYKPNGGFEERFSIAANTEDGVWDFVRTHLKYLPVVKHRADCDHLVAIAERDPRILYDQMVAYYVRKGYHVPLDSAAFQTGLSRRFSFCDGMYFLAEQVAEYERKKRSSGGMEQMSFFVSDEHTAIAWLRSLLRDKPLSFQDIHPLFINEIGGWQKHEKPLELSELLEQNFISYDGKSDVPSPIHSYLSTNFKELRNLSKDDQLLRFKGKDRWYVPDPNKTGDLEKLRERSLLKEFRAYQDAKQKKLKVFRTEAVRAGFKAAYEHQDYPTILAVAAKIPEIVLQEDEKLLMYHDVALMRSNQNTECDAN